MRLPFQTLVLPYRLRTGLEVAVLHRADYDAWQFVSGGGEDGETPAQAALREGREEAGISDACRYDPLDAMAMIPACWFGAWEHWPSHLLVVPEHAFAVDLGDHAIELSAEHDEVRWLHYDDAIRLLTFDSNRIALWELHERRFPAPRGKRPAFDTLHAGRCACSPSARNPHRTAPP